MKNKIIKLMKATKIHTNEIKKCINSIIKNNYYVEDDLLDKYLHFLKDNTYKWRNEFFETVIEFNKYLIKTHDIKPELLHLMFSIYYDVGYANGYEFFLFDLIKEEHLLGKYFNYIFSDKTIQYDKYINIILHVNDLTNITHLLHRKEINNKFVFNFCANTRINISFELKNFFHNDKLNGVILFKNLGYKYTKKDLEEACNFVANYDIIKEILDNNVKPTNACMFNILKTNNRYNNIVKIDKKVELLVNYGYEITYKDILYAIEKNYKFKNLDLKKYKFKEDFYEICAKNCFYPYTPDEIGVKYNLKCLQIEASNINSDKSDYIITKIIKSGVKADKQCIINAFNNYRKEIIELLLNNSIYDYQEALDIFIEIYNHRESIYKRKEYNNLYNKLVLLKEHNNKIINNQDAQNIQNTLITNKQNKNKNKILKVAVLKPFDVQINKRNTYKLVEDICKLLHLENNKMKYINIINHFIEYFKKNKMIIDKYIKLNKKIKEITFIKEDYINFSDIDILVQRVVYV